MASKKTKTSVGGAVAFIIGGAIYLSIPSDSGPTTTMPQGKVPQGKVPQGKLPAAKAPLSKLPQIEPQEDSKEPKGNVPSSVTVPGKAVPTLKDNQSVEVKPKRSLPQWSLGLQPQGIYHGQSKRAFRGVTAQVRVIEARNDSDRSLATYAKFASDNIFVIANWAAFHEPWKSVLSRDNIKGVVLGYFKSTAPSKGKRHIEAVRYQAQILQRITTAPVLLTVPYSLYGADKSGREWRENFDVMSLFDGVVVNKLVGFPSFEGLTLEKVRSRLNIPDDMPCYVSGFLGVRGGSNHSRQVLKYRFTPLVQKLKNQGWSGLFVSSTTPRGRQLKNEFITRLPQDLRLVE